MKTEKQSGSVVTEIRLDEIHESGRTQSRVSLNQDAIDSYQEAMEESPKAYPFAPIVVFRERAGAKTWIGDGWHRYRAARAAGRKTILAEVRQGGERAAVLFAAGANKDHGVHRTPEDKRKAVGMLLADPEWARWSDREIALHCAVSRPLVASVRSASTGSAASREPRKGADGREYDTTKIAASNAARPKPVRVVPEEPADAQDDEPAYQVDEPAAPAPSEPPRSFAADAQAVIDKLRATPPEEVKAYLAGPAPMTAAARRNGAAATALLDAEGKPVPERLARAWALLSRGADLVSKHLIAAQAEWTKLEGEARALAGELAAGQAQDSETIFAHCAAAGLPMRDLVRLADRFAGQGTDTVQHLGWQVRQLAPVKVCACGGTGCHRCGGLGWHSRAGAKERAKTEETLEKLGMEA